MRRHISEDGKKQGKMIGIIAFDISTRTTTYTYAETGYANPHAVKSVGGTNSRNKGERSRR